MLSFTRRELAEQRMFHLVHEFKQYFKPTVEPYNDPEMIALLQTWSDDDSDAEGPSMGHRVDEGERWCTLLFSLLTLDFSR